MYAIEAYKGARRILEPNIKAGESLALVGSTDVDPAYYEAYLAVAYEMGVEPVLGFMTPRSTYGKASPRPLIELARSADLAILTASTSLAHTETAMEVLRAGKRCITFPVPPGPRRATEVLAQQGIYDGKRILEVKDLSIKVARALDAGSHVQVTSPKGTNLTARIDGRKTHVWYGIAEPEVFMYGSWPPGDAHISAIEDSAEGEAVVDGYIGGMGIPSEPLTLRFQKGQLTEIKGNPVDVRKLEHIISVSDENARTFCEVGIGTSPYQPIINSNGDKYATGTFHLAIGASATPCFGGIHYDGKVKSNLHLDMVILAPVEVHVDGKLVVGGGKLLA